MLSRVFGVALALVFTFLAANTAWNEWNLFWRAQASEQWPQVTGQVIHVDSKERKLKGRRVIFVPVIRYTYTTDGRMFAGDRVAWGDNWSQERAEAVFNDYRSGQRVSVHVNPINPSDAVLEARELAPAPFFRYVMLLFCCFGLAGLFRVLTESD